MSLLRLLTAGKSLVGLQNDRSRYVSRGGLPKFGSKKNPFRATTKPELGRAKESLSVVAAEAATIEAVATGAEQSNGTVNAVTVSGQQLAEAAGQGSAPVVSEAQDAPAVRGGKGKGTRMDLSFDWSKVLFWRRPTPARQALPRFSKPMVQGELSLEGVKVVRNDLSDSDLEIVPAKPAPVSPPAIPAAAPSAKEISPETTWSRVTGRLFGAGKT